MSVLRTREIHNDFQIRLFVVEAVELQHGKTGSLLYCSGTKQPIAIVALDREGIHAFDMEAKPIRLNDLVEDVPDLSSVLGL